MKSPTTLTVLLVIVFISVVAHTAHSMSVGDRDALDALGRESHMADEVDSLESLLNNPMHSWLAKRRLDSAEKYFDWAGKTNRPMEYLRGKRFWLFTKKDEPGAHPEAVQESSPSSNAAKQGIWRSGIVGRRRR